MDSQRVARIRRRVGCWVHERRPAELVLRMPVLARRLGLTWLDLCNRGEQLVDDPLSHGRVCSWKDSSRLTVVDVFPQVGQRLLEHVIAEFPIALNQSRSRDDDRFPDDDRCPDVSFLVPFGGSERVQQLRLCLASLESQRQLAFEIIVVEQSSGASLSQALSPNVRYLHQPVPPGSEFNKSRAFNLAARAARAKALVLLDADLVVPESFGANCVGMLRHADAVRPARFIFYLDQSSTSRLTGDTLCWKELSMESVVANSPMPIAVLRSTYFELGGHDEDYEGWGGEDLEFLGRLRTRRVVEGGWLPILHMWHPPAPRKASGDRNRELHARKMAVLAQDRIARLNTLVSAELS